MGEGFSNPVTNAAGVLVRVVMKSINFVAGSAGWQITKAGSAEFNDATIRGSLAIGTAPNPRVFIGSTIPATLNFSPDFTWAEAVLWYFNNTDYYWEANGTYNPGPFPMRARGTYSVATPGTGIIIHEFIQRQATVSNVLYGSATYSAQPVVWAFRNGNIQVASDVVADFSSNTSFGGFNAYAIECSIGAVPEVFKTVNWLAAGWSGNLSYKQVAAPARSVQLSSTGITMGTKADGTKLFNIPAPYRPAASMDVPVSINIMGGGAAQSPHLNIATNGDTTIWGCASATAFGINAIYPLDSP